MTSGAIPAHRSAPAWRAGILTLLDRRAAEHRRFPSLSRSAMLVTSTEAVRSDGRHLEAGVPTLIEPGTSPYGILP